MSMIRENLEAVRTKIADACQRAGRDVNTVTLIAVSKTHPAGEIVEAASYGVQHFGENRVEESSIKIPEVRAASDAPIQWHMVGHIQSRKARDAASLFGWVHSVDTLKLAQKLSSAAHESRTNPLNVLLEINVSGEESKAGFEASAWETSEHQRAALADAVRQVAALPGLRLLGFMTMAPIVEHMEDARPVFSSLRRLRDDVAKVTGIALPELSMGMTDDYPVAIEEGATFVRIGRAIFGERIYL